MYNRKGMKKRLLTGMIALLVLAGCGQEPEPPEPVVDVEKGKAIVQAECMACHGLDGAGKTAEIPNLAGQSADYLVEAMHAYREDVRHHAALKDLITSLDESAIQSIAAYFAGLPPVPPQPDLPAGEAAYREGAEFAAACVECHGERGFSTEPGVPSLAGQHPMYLIVATQEYARGERDNAEKEAMLKNLGNVDIEKMAMYFAAQVPELRERPPFGDPAAGEAQTALCGGCHGARGVSDDPLVPNLAGQEPTYLVKAIKAYRDHERSHDDMVADKTDAEIEDIAAFYSIQNTGSEVETGAQTAEIIAKCDRCHGHAIGESSLVVPVLYGQKKEYLLRVMRQYRDEQRGSTMMHKMSAGYSDVVLAEIAEYYASHPSP
jgi:cytochrome c553